MIVQSDSAQDSPPMRHLHSFVAVAALVLLMGGIYTTIRRGIDSKAAAEKARTETGLAEMLLIWREYQLPLPPPDAPLVCFKIRSRYEGLDYVKVGFLVQDSNGPNPAVVLSGLHRIELDRDYDPAIIKTPPFPSTFHQLDLTGREGISGISSLLGVAVQCQARGLTEVAGYLFRKTSDPSDDRQGAVNSAYRLIWQHFQEEVLRPGSDRTALARKMKRLLDAGHDLPHGIGKRLHEALIATPLPAAIQPETIIAEALVERLNQSRIISDAIARDAPLDDPYYDLEAMGFAAVPVLIAHLNDQRPTGLMTAAMVGMQESRPILAGDLAAVLLQEILGDNLRQNWSTRLRPGTTFQDVALAMWEKARSIGEEAWLVEGAPASTNEEQVFPNECHLRLLKARYPERLEDVLRFQLQHRPKAVIHPIITALAESRLPGAKKIDLLKEAAAMRNDPDAGFIALKALSRYDPVYFNREAVKAFDGMRRGTKVDYWRSPEAGMSHLALCTDDAMVWAAFLRAAQRAETGLRMELMNPLRYCYIGGKYKMQRLSFLRAFLEDTIVRSLDEGAFSGPCAAFTIPRLRVCDFAAMQIAGIMGWTDRPDETWSVSRWDHLRGRAAQLLRQ